MVPIKSFQLTALNDGCAAFLGPFCNIEESPDKKKAIIKYDKMTSLLKHLTHNNFVLDEDYSIALLQEKE